MFQDHFYNKLRRSKLLLKYTDHLYGKQRHLTYLGIVTSEMVINRFDMSI